MTRTLTVVAILLTIVATLVYLALPCLTCEREVWDETLSEADQRGFDYCRNYHAAQTGDPAALDRFLAFSAMTDAASALGHGCAVIRVLRAVGDEAVSKSISRLAPAIRSEVRSVLEAGVAYGLDRLPEETPLLYPMCWKASSDVP